MSAATSNRSCAISSRVGIGLVREESAPQVQAKAHMSAEERVLDALVGSTASPATRDSFRKKLRDGQLDDKEIDIEVADSGSGMPGFEIPGMPRRQYRCAQPLRNVRQGHGRPHQEGAHHGERVL